MSPEPNAPPLDPAHLRTLLDAIARAIASVRAGDPYMAADIDALERAAAVAERGGR